MIGAKQTTFPTEYAIKIATNVKLFISEREAHTKQDEWFDLRDKLEEFQKLSLSCDFDTCLETAYYNFQMNEHQIEALRFIYEKTQLWLKGEVLNNLMVKLESPKTTGKEARELGELVVNEFINKESDSDKKQVSKSMLVKFANIPKGVKIPGIDNDEEE